MEALKREKSDATPRCVFNSLSIQTAAWRGNISQTTVSVWYYHVETVDITLKKLRFIEMGMHILLHISISAGVFLVMIAPFRPFLRRCQQQLWRTVCSGLIKRPTYRADGIGWLLGSHDYRLNTGILN